MRSLCRGCHLDPCQPAGEADGSADVMSVAGRGRGRAQPSSIRARPSWAASETAASRDLRLMASGPRFGFMELTLPEVQMSSSMIPGKSNPVLPEFMIQIAYQVCGNDTVVAAGIEGAEFDTNVWAPAIAKNLLESCRLLTRALPVFTDKCVQGVDAEAQHARTHAENTLGTATVLAAALGPRAGKQVAEHAQRNNTSVREAATALGHLTSAEADELLDPLALTDPLRSGPALDRIRERRSGDHP